MTLNARPEPNLSCRGKLTFCSAVHGNMKMLHLKTKEMGDPLTDSSPLISAAFSGKLRLVRLLVEGGAQVNGSNHRGETALLAACKALRGDPAQNESVKLLKFLLQNKADPNAQDQDGRTALMYACMQRAGALVASTLLAAGANPCMEDDSGTSALVYAINSRHQPTVQVLIDACRAKGRDIIIIATEMGVNSGPVTRRYLNVPLSPDSSPVSCMSPSDIVLKTGSPSSSEGGNIFNFRGTTGKHGSSSRRSSCELSQLSLCSSSASRQRVSSEPWLAINNLDSLNRVYEEGMRERNLKEEGNVLGLKEEERRGRDADEELCFQSKEDVVQRQDAGFKEDCKCWSKDTVLSPTEKSSTMRKSDSSVPKRCLSPERSDIKLPASSSPYFYLRRNSLPSVTVVPAPVHLPPLIKQPDSHLQVPANVLPANSRRMLFQPHPPNSSSPSSASSRAALLPLLPSTSSLVALPGYSHSERSRRSLRRHSAHFDQIKGGQNHLDSIQSDFIF